MSFQRPEFLLALLLALLPAAFYLSRYVRSTRTVFPAAPFLFARDRAPLARLRSRQIAATLLRAGVICLAALAFAGPVLQEPAPQKTTSVADRQVLVIDTSASMLARDANGETAQARALEAIRRRVAEAPPSIRYAVVPCPRPQGKLLWLPAEEVDRALEGLASAGPACHPGPLLRQLATTLPQSTRIHLFSDLQLDSKARQHLDQLLAAAGNLDVQSPGFEPSPNRTLVDLWVQPGGIGFLVATESEELPADTATLTCQETQLDVPMGTMSKGVSTFFAAIPPDLPAGLCRLTLPADGLLEDNSSWFTIQAPEQTRVLIVDGSPGHAVIASPGELLTAALRAGKSTIRVLRVAQTEFSYDSLQLADLVVFIDPRPLPRYLEKGLVEFMARGGHLWLFAGNALAQWPAENLVLPGLQARKCLALPEQPFRLAWASSDDPAAALLASFPESTLRQWTHVRHIALTFLGRDVSVLARFDDGVPTLLRAPFGQGELLLWSLVPSADNGNFALHPAFPLAIQAFFGQLARPMAKIELPPVCKVFEPCPLSLAATASGAQAEGGLSGKRQIPIPAQGEVICPEPGPYFRSGPEGSKLALVCQTAPGEGALRPVASPGVAVQEPLTHGAGRSSPPGPLVYALLLAALALILVELWMVSGRLKDRYEA
jgi:hypothetical protein